MPDRPLRILNVAYSLAPVGPDAVGGAEQVLSALDRALVAAGHRSIVVAWEESQVAGELVATPRAAAGTLDDAARARAITATRAAIARALAGGSIDLVHLHGIDLAETMPPAGVPVLATLHLPVAWYPRAPFETARPDTFFNCVSAAQHATAPAQPNLVAPIANGIDIAALSGARHARRGFALMLARVCEEKGQHAALLAAHRADVPLLLAGEVFDYPAHRAYFAERVAPLLDERRRFIGPVGGARKRRLLAAARCLLVPSTAAETSSLVAMEAAACGTPVIAFPSGALADTVEDGRTGFLVRDVGEMAAAIARADTIAPDLCRAVARQRFDGARMASEYLRLYRNLATRAGRRAA
jgi:glycosyltransferase involved in cell wall biosynthesis